jgi:hypothetical protein
VAVSLGEWGGPQLAVLAAAGRPRRRLRAVCSRSRAVPAPTPRARGVLGPSMTTEPLYYVHGRPPSLKRISGERGWLPGGGVGGPGVLRLELGRYPAGALVCGQ